MRLIKLSLVALSASVILPALAAGQDVADTQDGVVLDTIVVTSLRRATSLQSSTSSVTVIDSADIKHSAAPDLQSLLNAYNGVSVATNGGQGSSSKLFVRGMAGKQVVVLINGVRTASATSGFTALSNIPLSIIDRVEIAKGAHSALYGADAMGGVINIITKQGGACGERDWCGSVTTGVTNPWGGYASGSIQGRSSDGFDYAFGAGIKGTQGYDFTVREKYGHEDGRNGFLQGNFNYSFGKDLDWGRVYTDGFFSRSHNEYDNAAPGANRGYSTFFSGKLGARIDHSDDWSSTVELSTGLDHSRDYRKNVSGSDRYQTKRYGIFASTEKQIETDKVTHSLTAGAEAYQEKVTSTMLYDETKRNLAAVFGQYSLEYEALRFDGGLRYDHNEQFGDVVTYNAGVSYEILPDLTLRSSFGTGFRAPTFNELYYPSFPGFPPASNPDLQPEKSRSYEIGLNWQATTDTSVDMAFYQTRLRDAIIASAPDYTPENVQHAKITGFETSLTHRFDERWGVKGSLDLKRATDEDTGKELPYRERVKATMEVNYAPIEKLDLTARLLYGGPRYNDIANKYRLDSFVTADIVMLYQIDDKSQLKFSVENLFNKEYQTVKDYIAPGRTINLGLTRSF